MKSLREEWFAAAVEAFYSHVPKGTHCLFIVHDDSGTGLSSCCDPSSEPVREMLESASALAAFERQHGDERWTLEADANGTH